MEKKLKFGTDGWRAILADEFTFENFSLIILAISKFLISNNLNEKGVFIGYDNRFLSEEFAKQASKIFAKNDIKVFISKESIPTPTTAFMVRELKLDGAIMITASHNPPIYNGVKFIPDYGGPADNNITRKIESIVNDLIKNKDSLDLKIIESDNYDENINYIFKFDSYKNKLIENIDSELIKKNKPKIAVDTMFGSGSKILPEILIDVLNIEPTVFHNYRDTLFGGKLPDPSENNLLLLKNNVIKNNLDLGIALDGDADRFGVIDGKGIFISPNNIISLILYYLIKTRKYSSSDRVVRSIATTHLIDAICEKNNINVLETPVGFKYIGKEMINNDVIVGGEESGGLSIKGHIPEKDGLLAVLLLVEIQSFLNKKFNSFYLSDYLNKIRNEFGNFKNRRLDIKIPIDKKSNIINYFLDQKDKIINSKKVVNVIDKEGVELIFEDKSWILVRPSGTEPLIRCYIESTDGKFFNFMQKFVKNTIDRFTS